MAVQLERGAALRELRARMESAWLRVSRPAMIGLLNGRAALSADMAGRFERAFGMRAETMFRMQAAHDLVAARARVREVVRVVA